jgi:uncharacterized protein (DUF697 family)
MPNMKIKKQEETKDVSTEESGNELKAHRIITKHIYGAACTGLIPIPMVDLVALSGIQLNMVRRLANLYGLEFRKDLVKPILGSFLGGVLPLAAAGPIASFIKIVPVVGQITSFITMPVLGGAATFAVGKVFVQHFEAGGTFLSFDPEKVRDHFAEKFKEGREYVSSLKKDSA